MAARPNRRSNGSTRKKAIADDIENKFAEAKAVGFDVKALRKIIALRKNRRTNSPKKKPFSRLISTRWAWPMPSTNPSLRLPSSRSGAQLPSSLAARRNTCGAEMRPIF